jgi:hypothetical protein
MHLSSRCPNSIPRQRQLPIEPWPQRDVELDLFTVQPTSAESRPPRDRAETLSRADFEEFQEHCLKKVSQ